MSQYTSDDFLYSMDRANIETDAVAQVLEAFGRNGDYGEWDGGFLLEMEDGTFAVLTGGWSCQDFGNVDYFDTYEGAKADYDGCLDDCESDPLPRDLLIALEGARKSGEWTDSV